MKLNPYPYEPSFEDRSCNISYSAKPNIIHPKKITMNGNSYQKVETKIEN